MSRDEMLEGIDKMELFENEWTTVQRYDAVFDYRWQVAMHIVGHCAMVAARARGEDSAGRQALKLLDPKEVAERALSIADGLIAGAIERGWVKGSTVTDEQRMQYAGLLKNLELYPRFGEKDAQKAAELLADIVKLKETGTV